VRRSASPGLISRLQGSAGQRHPALPDPGRSHAGGMREVARWGREHLTS